MAHALSPPAPPSEADPVDPLVRKPPPGATKASSPLDRRRLPRPPGRLSQIPEPRAPPSLRILVVEDDALIQMLVCETLADMGHVVCAVAATEDDAVEAASRHEPDLMIVDVRLGLGDGLAAIRTILQTRLVAVIVVSGEVIAPERLSPGAVPLLKPYQDHELARAIARAMA